MAVPVKEVRRLADFYNYEVENPCVINTQAVSASFLKEPKDTHNRYGFFLKASNLETLRQGFLLSRTLTTMHHSPSRLCASPRVVADSASGRSIDRR